MSQALVAQVDAAIGMLVHTQAQRGAPSALNAYADFAGSRAITGKNGVAQVILDAGNTQAASLIETTVLEAAQAAQGQENVDFNRWFGLLTRAKESVQAMQSLTPQESAATAAPISARQNALEAQIRQLSGQIGGRASVKGALIGTSTEPIQMELASISRQIRDAHLLPVDRQALLDRQRQLLGQTEQTVVAAGREGADVADAIDKLESLRQDLGGDFFDCIVHGESKLSCFMEGSGKWVTFAIALAGIGAVLWFSMPFIRIYLLTRSRK